MREACTSWLAENYPGSYSHCSTSPPLDFPDDHFELIYSLSVFSHLNYESNLDWLKELARVCKPGGRIILSTHGSFALFVIANSQEHQDQMRLPKERAGATSARPTEDGLPYHHIGAEAVKILEGPEDDYGQAFMTEAFARREWADHVEVLGVIPVIQNFFQDFFVLTPKK